MKQYNTFNFDHRGITSLLNSTLGLYEKSILSDRNQIYINSDRSIYFKELSFFNIFKPNEALSDIAPKKGEITPIGSSSRWFACKRYKPQLPPEELSKCFIYTDEIKSKIDLQIESLDLPKNYSCFHIRRGDKLITEAKKFDFSSYLAKAKELDNIFIMSDDYTTLEEAKSFISNNNLNYKIFSLTKNSQRGNVEKKGRFSEEDIIQFFAEIEIAKSSKKFVGTFSSNIYRYIKHTCVSCSDFCSLD